MFWLKDGLEYWPIVMIAAIIFVTAKIFKR